MPFSAAMKNIAEDIVAHKSRFDSDSQARTPQLVHTSWREIQLGRNQLECSARQGPAISHETGTRPKGYSYVYKYQFVTQVE
jgi:hypothetical protein